MIFFSLPVTLNKAKYCDVINFRNWIIISCAFFFEIRVLNSKIKPLFKNCICLNKYLENEKLQKGLNSWYSVLVFISVSFTEVLLKSINRNCGFTDGDFHDFIQPFPLNFAHHVKDTFRYLLFFYLNQFPQTINFEIILGKIFMRCKFESPPTYKFHDNRGRPFGRT